MEDTVGLSFARAESMTGPSPVRPGNARFASVAATVRLGHLVFQTKRWNEAIRMADPKGAVAIARHHHAGSVGADDIKATAF
jgi:hypothetical protein